MVTSSAFQAALMNNASPDNKMDLFDDVSHLSLPFYHATCKSFDQDGPHMQINGKKTLHAETNTNENQFIRL